MTHRDRFFVWKYSNSNVFYLKYACINSIIIKLSENIGCNFYKKYNKINLTCPLSTVIYLNYINKDLLNILLS